MATSASNPSEISYLEIGSDKYNVLNYQFDSSKPTDKLNRVTAFATHAKASFVLEGTEKTTKLFEIYANSRKRFDAKLVLNNVHGEGKLMETMFKDTSITYYAEKYTTDDEMPYTITVVFNAKQIEQNAALLAFNEHIQDS